MKDKVSKRRRQRNYVDIGRMTGRPSPPRRMTQDLNYYPERCFEATRPRTAGGRDMAKGRASAGPARGLDTAEARTPSGDLACPSFKRTPPAVRRSKNYLERNFVSPNSGRAGARHQRRALARVLARFRGAAADRARHARGRARCSRDPRAVDATAARDVPLPRAEDTSRRARMSCCVLAADAASGPTPQKSSLMNSVSSNDTGTSR